MKDIHIPPTALEAGSEAVANAKLFGRTAEEIARAAFVAMVEAWPNQHIIDDDVVYILHALILPLTENPDDKA